MIAYAWPGSSVIHFGLHLIPNCFELAHGPMGAVAEAVYHTSIWDGACFDIPNLATALQSEDYDLAERIREEYASTLRAKIDELVAQRGMAVPA